jgi:hypothetical protein
LLLYLKLASRILYLFLYAIDSLTNIPPFAIASLEISPVSWEDHYVAMVEHMGWQRTSPNNLVKPKVDKWLEEKEGCNCFGNAYNYSKWK